jgi:hypothetical protein
MTGVQEQVTVITYPGAFLPTESARANQTRSGVITPQPIASNSIQVVVGSASVAPSLAPL